MGLRLGQHQQCASLLGHNKCNVTAVVELLSNYFKHLKFCTACTTMTLTL